MDEDTARMPSQSAGPTAKEVVDALARQSEVPVLHGITIGGQGGSARIDHVIVDPHGLLVIQVKAWKGATVRGRQADATWSVRMPEGRTEIVSNPVRESEELAARLLEALTGAGWVLGPESVRGIAAVQGADISEVQLDPVTTPGLTDLNGLVGLYAARVDSPPLANLPAEMLGPLADAIVHLRPAAPSMPAAVPVEARREDTSSAAAARTLPAPAKAARGEKLRDMAVLVAGLAALIVIAWVAIALLGNRGGGAGRGGFRPEETSVSAPAPETVVPKVEEPVEAAIKPDVALAKRRLKETLPDRYGDITDPDDPRIIDVAAGQITYEWDYLAKSASNAVSVGRVSITLDAAGEVIGASE